MYKRRLLRLLIPALLIGGALLIWGLSGQGSGIGKSMWGGGMPVALIVLALLFSAQPLLEEMFEIPLVYWIIAVLVAMVGIGLLFSNAVGFLGIALVAVAALLFLFS
jgi:hypothetical protein